MRCLVTGAAGFIGSHLSARLLRDGHEVVGLDDLSEGKAGRLPRTEMSFIEGDLRDRSTVCSAATGCDVIFHQGAVRSVPRSMIEPELVTDVNVGGTLNVLTAARENDAMVVSASSSSVYGDQPTQPFREDLVPQPRSPYAASKLAGEIYCETWGRAFGVRTISLRYFNVYGPGQDPHSEYAVVVPRFIMAALEGRPAVIHGTGDQARDFTFIDDVVEANVLAADAPPAAWGRSFNIGGGREPTTVKELHHLVSEMTGSRVPPRHAAPREGDVFRTHADLSLASGLLGYRPKMDVREGLERTVRWFSGADGRVSLVG